MQQPLALDAGVYRLQRNERPGQYPGLGALLGVLKERGLDESWYRFLASTFTSPAGANLRNEVAHGFAANIGPVYAAVILQAVLYLALQETGNSSTNGGDEVDDDEADAQAPSGAAPTRD